MQNYGSILYRGPETGQYGRMLTVAAQYADYTGDYQLPLVLPALVGRGSQAAALTPCASAPANPPEAAAYGMIAGWSEAVNCRDRDKRPPRSTRRSSRRPQPRAAAGALAHGVRAAAWLPRPTDAGGAREAGNPPCSRRIALPPSASVHIGPSPVRDKGLTRHPAQTARSNYPEYCPAKSNNPQASIAAVSTVNVSGKPSCSLPP